MANANDNIPNWIEPKLFENALHTSLGDYKKILSFKAFPALAPGENYATVMIKIATEVLLNNGETQSQSFMLKVAHDNELQKNEISKWDMFGTEAGMYQEIVPDFEQLYAKQGLNVKFGAKSYQLPVECEYILLEDLSKRGFKNAPRQNCLDMEHCQAVLKKLAQWHAAGAKRFESKGPYNYKYAKGMLIESGRSMFITMMESSLKHLINSAKKLPNNGEYLEQLESLPGRITDLLFDNCGTFDENEFNTLNHGDCWSNNIMFQYDKEGKLQETYFVDLQIAGYGSVAQDLLYFIISSAHLDIKIKKFDYLIKYYHDHLVEHLKILKYEKALPTLKDLHRSIIRRGMYGFFAALMTMAVVLCDTSSDASVDNLVGGNEESEKFKELMFSNPRIVKHLAEVLPWFCYRGVFEC